MGIRDLATEEFRSQIVTERESWILDNKDKNPNLTVAQNADLIEPGMEFAPPDFRQAVEKEVKQIASTPSTPRTARAPGRRS